MTTSTSVERRRTRARRLLRPSTFIVPPLLSLLPLSAATAECMKRSVRVSEHAPAIVLIPVDEVKAYQALGYDETECDGLFFVARATMQAMCSADLQTEAVTKRAINEIGISPAAMCQSGKRAALPSAKLNTVMSSVTAPMRNDPTEPTADITPLGGSVGSQKEVR